MFVSHFHITLPNLLYNRHVHLLVSQVLIAKTPYFSLDHRHRKISYMAYQVYLSNGIYIHSILLNKKIRRKILILPKWTIRVTITNVCIKKSIQSTGSFIAIFYFQCDSISILAFHFPSGTQERGEQSKIFEWKLQKEDVLELNEFHSVVFRLAER